MAGFYAALRRQNDAAPLADFATALNRCENWLSNRIFKSFDDIVDHCCHAWNKLAIGLRDWARAIAFQNRVIRRAR